MDESVTGTDEGRRQSILKPRHRLPLHEVQSFYPDDEATVTNTLTRNRRVSFGRKLIKEFIVGSAASDAQPVFEYEQSSESISDRSDCSGPLDLALNKTVPSGFTPAAAPAMPLASDTATQCANISKDPEERARLFTANCINIAKSVFQDTETELTAIIIGAKPGAAESSSCMSFTNLDISHRFDQLTEQKLSQEFGHSFQSELLECTAPVDPSYPVDKSRFDFLDRSISQAAQQLGSVRISRPSVRTPLSQLNLLPTWDDENYENIPPAHRQTGSSATPTRILTQDNTMEFTCANPKHTCEINERESSSKVHCLSDMEETCARPFAPTADDTETDPPWSGNNSFEDDTEDPLLLDCTRGFLSDFSGSDNNDEDNQSETEGSPLRGIQKELANLSQVNQSYRQQLQALNVSGPVAHNLSIKGNQPLIESHSFNKSEDGDELNLTENTTNKTMYNDGDEMEITEAIPHGDVQCLLDEPDPLALDNPLDDSLFSPEDSTCFGLKMGVDSGPTSRTDSVTEVDRRLDELAAKKENTAVRDQPDEPDQAKSSIKPSINESDDEQTDGGADPFAQDVSLSMDNSMFSLDDSKRDSLLEKSKLTESYFKRAHSDSPCPGETWKKSRREQSCRKLDMASQKIESSSKMDDALGNEIISVAQNNENKYAAEMLVSHHEHLITSTSFCQNTINEQVVEREAINSIGYPSTCLHGDDMEMTEANLKEMVHDDSQLDNASMSQYKTDYFLEERREEIDEDMEFTNCNRPVAVVPVILDEINESSRRDQDTCNTRDANKPNNASDLDPVVSSPMAIPIIPDCSPIRDEISTANDMTPAQDIEIEKLCDQATVKIVETHPYQSLVQSELATNTGNDLVETPYPHQIENNFSGIQMEITATANNLAEVQSLHQTEDNRSSSEVENTPDTNYVSNDQLENNSIGNDMEITATANNLDEVQSLHQTEDNRSSSEVENTPDKNYVAESNDQQENNSIGYDMEITATANNLAEVLSFPQTEDNRSSSEVENTPDTNCICESNDKLENNSIGYDMEITATANNLDEVQSRHQTEDNRSISEFENTPATNYIVESHHQLENNSIGTEMEITATANNLAEVQSLHHIEDNRSSSDVESTPDTNYVAESNDQLGKNCNGNDLKKNNLTEVKSNQELENNRSYNDMEITTAANNLTGVQSLHQWENNRSDNYVVVTATAHNVAEVHHDQHLNENHSGNDLEVTATPNNVAAVQSNHKLENNRSGNDVEVTAARNNLVQVQSAEARSPHQIESNRSDNHMEITGTAKNLAELQSPHRTEMIRGGNNVEITASSNNQTEVQFYQLVENNGSGNDMEIATSASNMYEVHSKRHPENNYTERTVICEDRTDNQEATINLPNCNISTALETEARAQLLQIESDPCDETFETHNGSELPMTTPLAGLACLAQRPSLREKLMAAPPDSTTASLMENSNTHTTMSALVKTMSDERHMQAICESTRIVEARYSMPPDLTYPIPEVTYTVQNKPSEVTYCLKNNYYEKEPCDPPGKRSHSDSPCPGERVKKPRASHFQKALASPRAQLEDSQLSATFSTPVKSSLVQGTGIAPQNKNNLLPSFERNEAKNARLENWCDDARKQLPSGSVQRENDVFCKITAQTGEEDAEIGGNSYTGPSVFSGLDGSSVTLQDVSLNSTATSMEKMRDEYSENGVAIITPLRPRKFCAEVSSMFCLDEITKPSNFQDLKDNSMTVPQVPTLLMQTLIEDDDHEVSSTSFNPPRGKESQEVNCLELFDCTNISRVRPIRTSTQKSGIEDVAIVAIPSDLMGADFEQNRRETCVRVLTTLTDQSKEENCIWKIQNWRNCKESEGFVSIKIPLLDQPLVLDITFSAEGPIVSFSTTKIKPEPFQWPENELVNDLGFTLMNNYIQTERRKLIRMDQLPQYMDYFNAFAQKVTKMMQDCVTVLRGCAFSKLSGHKLSVRLYSFPDLMSCWVNLDLMDLVLLGVPTISFRHEMGRLDETSVRSLLSRVSHPTLQNFVKSALELITSDESKNGYYTRRPQLLF